MVYDSGADIMILIWMGLIWVDMIFVPLIGEYPAKYVAPGLARTSEVDFLDCRAELLCCPEGAPAEIAETLQQIKTAIRKS